jgi:hypothetical protein
MLFQYFLIGVLFLAATFYVGRLFWGAFFSPSTTGCAKGCGGACGTLDVDRLQRTIEAATQKAGPAPSK